MGDVADEQAQRLVPGAAFEVVNAVHRAQVHGIDGEAVERVGGQGGDLAPVQAIDDALDQLGLRFVGMDAK